MDWRLPDDDFGQDLSRAFGGIVAEPGTSRCLDSLEPILSSLYLHYDESRVRRLGLMGFDLFDAVDAQGNSVAADVWHFCDGLREVGPCPSACTENVGTLLVWLRRLIREREMPG